MDVIVFPLQHARTLAETHHILGEWPAGIQTSVRATCKLMTRTAGDEFIQNKFSVGTKLAASITCSPAPTSASTIDLFNAQKGLIHVPRL